MGLKVPGKKSSMSVPPSITRWDLQCLHILYTWHFTGLPLRVPGWSGNGYKPRYIPHPLPAVPDFLIERLLEADGLRNTDALLQQLETDGLIRRTDMRDEWLFDSVWRLPDGRLLSTNSSRPDGEESEGPALDVDITVSGASGACFMSFDSADHSYDGLSLTTAGITHLGNHAQGHQDASGNLAAVAGTDRGHAKPAKKRRGRPASPEVAGRNKRMLQAWETGEYRTYAELGKAFSVSDEVVRSVVRSARRKPGKSQ